MVSRRQFLALGSLAAAAFAAQRRSYGAARSFDDDDYARAVVIDALGSIDEPQPGSEEAPPSTRLLQDIRASGVTAISMTLSVGSTGDRMQKALRRIAILDEKVAAAPQVLVRIRTSADLRTAKATQRLGLIYNVQDSSLLENDLTRVPTLQALGLRVMQMTYNTRNLVGDGCLERSDGGLSNLGRELVAQLNRSRVLMDLSHGGPRTIGEALAAARAPPIISHTGCRDVVDHPRNVFDAQLRALADKGGVVGIYFMPFLAERGAATRADLIRHLEHAVQVCGEDHVGLGTDGSISATRLDAAYHDTLRKEYSGRVAQGIAARGEDEYQLIPDYNEPRRFLHVAADLARRGWPAARIEKLLGANFARVFGAVWG